MLLNRPFPKNTETLPSYLLRLTEANGYKNPMQLLRTEQVQFMNNRLPSKRIFFGEFNVERIATMANVDSSVLHPLKFQPSGSSRSLVFGKKFLTKSFNFTNFRICPDCYEENKQFQFIDTLMLKTYCVKHNRPLTSLHQRTGKLLTWGTHFLWREIREAQSKPSNYDVTEAEYLINDLAEKLNQHPLLINEHAIDMPGACDLLNFFAHYHNVAYKHRLPETSRYHVDYCRQYFRPAYWYLEDWPYGFFELLSHFENNPMGQKQLTGIRKCFRDLYDDIYSQENGNSHGYQLLRSGFETYLSNHFSFGILPTSLSRISKHVIATANHMSESQILEQSNWPPSKLKRLLRENLLSPDKLLQNGKKLFLRSVVLNLNTRLSKCLSLTQCANLLDISTFQTRQLLKAGIIKPLLQPDESNRDWLIERKQVDYLLQHLRQGATHTDKTIDYAPNVKRFCFAKHDFTDLAEKMLSGSIAYCFKSNEDKPFSIRQFYPVFECNEQQISGYLSPRQAAQVLAVNLNAIYDFIKLGYLNVELKSVKRTPRPVKMITISSTVQFKARFILAGKQGKTMRQHTKISGPGIDGCCVNVYLAPK